MNVIKRSALFILSLFLIFLPSFSQAASQVVGGDNKIETALEISQRGAWANMILVNDRAYGDMASAVNLASKEKASILLNPQGGLLASNLEEIQRVQPATVFILGGPEAISDQAEAAIQAQGYTTRRFSGKDPYETNQMILDHVFAGPKIIPRAALVNPDSPSDLAAIAAYAYQDKLPLILSDNQGQVLDDHPFLDKVQMTFLVGSEDALSDQVAQKAPAPLRIAGQDAYQTSAMIHRLFFSEEGSLYLARGQDAAEALVGVGLLEKGDNIRLVDQSVKEIKDRDRYQLTRLGQGVRDGNGIAIYVNPHQDDETLTMGLQLIRDANEGREIYLLQMTRGGTSSIIDFVNQRLVAKGLSPIDREEFSRGRDNEVIGVLNVLGLPKEAFVAYDFKERLRSHMVVQALTDFTNRFYDTDIVFRTMATNPPGKDYDASAGTWDHRMCCEGVEIFMEKPPLNGNAYEAKYFIGARTNQELPGFIKTVATPEEAPIYSKMIDQYNVWDPQNGRYRIGFLSVSSEFEIKRANKNMYEQE